MTSTFQATGAGSTGSRLPTTNWYLIALVLLASVVGALLASGILYVLIRKTQKKDWAGLTPQPIPGAGAMVESVPTSRPTPAPGESKPTQSPTRQPAPVVMPTVTENQVDKNTPSNQPEGPAQEDEQTPD